MCKALLYEVQAAVVRSPRNRRNRLRKDRFQDWGLGPLPFQGRVCSSSAAVVCLGVGLILHGLSFFKRYIRFLYINISIFAIIFAISFILFFPICAPCSLSFPLLLFVPSILCCHLGVASPWPGAPFHHIPTAKRMLEEFPKWKDQDHNQAVRRVVFLWSAVFQGDEKTLTSLDGCKFVRDCITETVERLSDLLDSVESSEGLVTQSHIDAYPYSFSHPSHIDTWTIRERCEVALRRCWHMTQRPRPSQDSQKLDRQTCEKRTDVALAGCDNRWNVVKAFVFEEFKTWFCISPIPSHVLFWLHFWLLDQESTARSVFLAGYSVGPLKAPYVCKIAKHSQAKIARFSIATLQVELLKLD